MSRTRSPRASSTTRSGTEPDRRGRSTRSLRAAALGLLALAACAKAATPPKALIAEVPASHVGVPVQLDGSGSTATREGAALSYTWSFTALPALSRASLNDAHLALPSFVPDAAGTYGVLLVVDDGILSDSARLEVSVLDDCRPAPALAANPGAPAVGQTVELTSAATVSCGGASAKIVRWRWSFAAAPAGSRAVLLQAETARASFVPDVRGTYDVVLSATDEHGLVSDPLAAASHLALEVKACGDNVPVIDSVTAVPSAPNVQQLVVLSAAVSHADTAAACGLTRSFSWAWRLLGLPAGSKAALNNAAIAAPSFTPDVAGTYQLALVVTDDLGHASKQKTLSLTTTACGGSVPTAEARGPSASATGEVVQLHTYVTNADNPSLDGLDPIGGAGTPAAGQCGVPLSYAYQWRLVAAPLGSRATLSGTTLANPSLRPDVAGDYVASVTVTASTGRSSAPSPITVRAAACGSVRPTIDSVAATSPKVTGAPIKVSANVSDANGPCAAAVGSALPFTWSWALAAAPAGSGARLSGTAADGRSAEQSPGFVPDRPGDYVLDLRVQNRLGLTSDARTLTVTVADCRAPLTFADPAHPIVAPAGVVTGGVAQLSASPVDPNDPAGSACVAAVAPFTYEWTLAGVPPGSRAALNNPAASAPSFVADVAGTYAVQLVVTDAAGNRSPRVEQTVVADDCSAPLDVRDIVPLAGQTPTVGLPLSLQATVTDPNATSTACGGAGPFTPLSYAWSFLDVVPGSTAELKQANTATPSFVPDRTGSNYRVLLRVTNARGTTGSGTGTITVAATCLAAPSVTGLVPPAGVTGAPLQLGATGLANPSATAACGAAGTPVTWSWSLAAQPKGSLARLNSPGSANPSFTPDVGGTYTVQLQLADAPGNKSPVYSRDVAVDTCTAPFASVTLAAPASPKVNAALPLAFTYSDPNASLSSCGLAGTATSTPVSAEWTLLSRPPGSAAAFSDTTTSTPVLLPDKAGSYVVQVRATDALGNRGLGASTLVVSGCATSAPTVSVSSSALFPETGQAVALAATVTDANAGACGVPTVAPFSYAWTLSGPGGSSAVLRDGSGPQPSFTPDLAGAYDYKVVVTDALGLQASLASSGASTIAAKVCTLAPAITPAAGTYPAFSTLQLLGTAGVAPSTTSTTCGAGPAQITIPVRYAWSFDSLAKGSAAVLNDTAIPNPSFLLDVPSVTSTAFVASWTVRLTVTDLLNGNTVPLTQTYTANTCFSTPPVGAIGIAGTTGPASLQFASTSSSTPPGLPPTANVTLRAAGTGTNPIGVVPASVQFSGAGVLGGPATSNPNVACASPAPSLNYRWSIYQLPPGSTADIRPATAALPVLTVDRTGFYVVQLIADDGTLRGAPVYYVINVVP